MTKPSRVAADSPPSCRSLAASAARWGVEMEPGFVYFAVIPMTCVLKIGFSRNPEGRVKKVAADYNASGLKVVGKFPGRVWHERRLHCAMSHYRIWLHRCQCGEFYYLTPTTIDFFQGLVRRQGVEDWKGQDWGECTRWLREQARAEKAEHAEAFAAHRAILSAIPGFLQRGAA